MPGAEGAGRSRVAPVSVVIPCYCCAGTIERAVRSVAEQTQRPAELILVDDGSPDGTGAELERLRQRFGADWIRIIGLPGNAGSASARNAGWDAATQPYVAFLDSDDAWHPRKIEIQCAWMEAHPDVAVTGHGASQLAPSQGIPADAGGGEARLVSRRALYASNQFITPSAMVRREIPQRFEPGKRYMEDYLLWLEILGSGRRIARLPHTLAYTFKAPFGEAGLSARPWKMEQGELAVFATLRRKGQIGAGPWLLLSGFSLLKFLRRMLMLATGYSPSGSSPRPALIYVGAYLALTQAMTALLIFAGLAGHSELAAEFGVVQAATLATFFAFSGNARNLILTERARVSLPGILAVRLLLLLPLGAAAALLCVIVGRFDAALIAILVARRGIEWVGELHLSVCELRGDSRTARRSLLLQAGLLLLAAGAIALGSEHLLWALAAWALLPAIPLAGFVVRGAQEAVGSLRLAALQLLPHFGATAASGMSLYAFRALLVLVAGKEIAGDLFAAFAIGSFPGSMFANVLGASVSLHEERVGRAYLPKALWTVTTLYLFAGAALLVLHWIDPGFLARSGKTPLFWLALGASLIGGVIMIVAQRVRLRLIAGADARDLFGADVLMHVYLIAAIPALYAMGRSDGLALLYFLNAALALLFYTSALRGQVVPYGTRASERLVFVIAFLVFLPMFVLTSGHLFNPPEPLFDSGGMLSHLPLPLSLLACSGGLLLIGRFSRATEGLWAIFGLLFLMLVSTAVAGGESVTLDRAKMLLLLQILLPTFGLVLGAVLDLRREDFGTLGIAIMSVVAIVVPAQLAATWLEGYRTLRHSVFLFGVYQHLQFVPVILVSAYFVALPGVWARWRAGGRVALSLLLVLLAVYAVAAHSVLAMFGVFVGTALFGFARLRRGEKLAAALLTAAVVAGFAGYLNVVKDTYEFHYKFSFLFPPEDPWPTVGGYSAGVKPRLRGGWQVVGLPVGGRLLLIDGSKLAHPGTLEVAGELDSGEVAFLVEDESRTSLSSRAVASGKGSFRVEVPFDFSRGDRSVIIFQSAGDTRGVISRLRWIFPSTVGGAKSSLLDAIFPDAGAAPPANSDDDVVVANSTGVRNVLERLSDWRLFGHGLFDSPRHLLFGHSKPLAREQRSSAHNFYIDFSYNFGLLALLPVFALIAHTASLLWRTRRRLPASESLFALAAVVAFLVLVECNLKVSLRQPYPGIAIYFLWGLLLSRLRGAGDSKAA